MRCKNIDINKINTFLINSINQLNTLYLENNKSNIKEYYTKFYRTFIRDFYKLIYTNKNNNIYIVNKFDNFINLYIELYKKNKSIIGNYKNETCIQTNNIIKEKILESDKNEANNIVYVDNHFINEQIIFMEHYEKYNTSDKKIMVKIIDEGEGFKEKDTSRIFKRFYSNRPDKFGENSGLGLNIVKNLVDLHDGEIIASNRVDNEGAIIDIKFPSA